MAFYGHEGGEKTGQLEGVLQPLWRSQHAQVLSVHEGLLSFPGCLYYGELFFCNEFLNKVFLGDQCQISIPW